ncbi:hypothetical protein EK21DRAFT_81443 [Setomelanomma holmii]|uniref:Peptidase A1 domain-containing protein n=1 Tax=Setomelanomma holmii TaxID=210430 RepID=A0A9P4LFG6_9PLEO|nr:hypothetical protein EK21DRAFT_81443 [Setomelanomma holmii]
MFSSAQLLLFVASVALPTSNAASCKPLVVFLPFKSTVLVSKAQTRGIQWQVGGPSAQTLALLPSATYNDSYIYGGDGLCPADFSSPEMKPKCTTYRGGIYSIEQSQTEQSEQTILRVADQANANWTKDKVVLKNTVNNNIELDLFEFGIRVGSSQPYVNKGEIGLGVNSSFLEALASGQQIASRTYSFFWGTDSTISSSPRDGSLTLGGYDQALFNDSVNTTTTFTGNQANCREGMIVDLTGLVLQSKEVGTQNILNGTEKLRACVVPTLSSVLMLPESYWKSMASIMGVETFPGNNGTSNELLYGVAAVKPRSANFTGNLSISINNAITVTVPNKRLIIDEPYISVKEGKIESNSSVKVIPIAKFTDTKTNDMPRIGGMFFSEAVLTVNHDKNEFTISPANDTPIGQKLMGIDSANGCIAAVDGGATTAPEAPKTSDTPRKPARLSGGAIAGIVVGVVSALLIIAGVAYKLWEKKEPTSRTAELNNAQSRALVSEKYGFNTSEMYAGQRLAEVASHERDYVVELDGSERPLEAPAHEGAQRR